MHKLKCQNNSSKDTLFQYSISMPIFIGQDYLMIVVPTDMRIEGNSVAVSQPLGHFMFGGLSQLIICHWLTTYVGLPLT